MPHYIPASRNGHPSRQAARLHAAIEATTAAGVLTRDLGGTATTKDVTKALMDALSG